VRDVYLSLVQPGTLVSFTTSANPSRRYTGPVASVDAMPISGTLLYRARIIERNPDLSLRGGLEVTVRITTQTHRNVLSVPRAAVIQNGAKGMLYAVEKSDGKATAKQLQVKLGLQTSEYVEVSGADLHAGMPIVLNQADNLHTGAVLAIPSASPIAR
jgi:multidrug efflux pump subunit AcrA (membrane-fusion protein)